MKKKASYWLFVYFYGDSDRTGEFLNHGLRPLYAFAYYRSLRLRDGIAIPASHCFRPSSLASRYRMNRILFNNIL